MFLVAGGNPRPPALSDNPGEVNCQKIFKIVRRAGDKRLDKHKAKANDHSRKGSY